jgi:hypothetical protein
MPLFRTNGVEIMTTRTRSLTIAGLVLVTLLLAGCSGDVGSGITTTAGGGETTTTAEEVAPTTTQAPATTTTSAQTGTTAPPDSGEDDSTTGLLIIVGIILLVVVIIAISASRRSKKAEAAAAGAAAVGAPVAAPDWKTSAEQAYSQSRWLYENLTADLALWRGDMLQSGSDPSPEPASDVPAARQQTWDQLGTQMTAATTTLYGLEAQVGETSQPVVRSVVDALYSTRTAVDDVASARLAVHHASDALAGDSGNEGLQQDLTAAHDQENQSAHHLNNSRTVLQGALANLAALN